jgi:hypothetical protein
MVYHPTLGEWIQRDRNPDQYSDGMNLYQFDDSNPPNRVDPLGLAGETTASGALNAQKQDLDNPIQFVFRKDLNDNKVADLYYTGHHLEQVGTYPMAIAGQALILMQPSYREVADSPRFIGVVEENGRVTLVNNRLTTLGQVYAAASKKPRNLDEFLVGDKTWDHDPAKNSVGLGKRLIWEIQMQEAALKTADENGHLMQANYKPLDFFMASRYDNALELEGAIASAAYTIAASWALAPLGTLGSASRLAGPAARVSTMGAEAAEESVWTLAPTARGFAIESKLGGNLPPGFRVIDRFNNGVATSIKSVDLKAPTYQNLQLLTNKLDGFVDDVKAWQGCPRPYAGVDIQPNLVLSKQVQVAVPQGAMTPAQQSVFSAAVQRAQNFGIKLIITPIR